MIVSVACKGAEKMDIADYSMAMNIQSLQQAISISVMSKAMNQDTMGVQSVLECISEVKQTTSLEPSFNVLDVRA